MFPGYFGFIHLLQSKKFYLASAITKIGKDMQIICYMGIGNYVCTHGNDVNLTLAENSIVFTAVIHLTLDTSYFGHNSFTFNNIL